MHLIAKAIRISCAKLHCNRLTTVQDIQDYASLIWGGGHIVYGKTVAEMVAAAVAGIVAVTAALIALCRSLYSTSSQTASLVLALIFV